MQNNNSSFQANFNSNLPTIKKVDFDGKQKHSINSWELFEKLELKNYGKWCSDNILTRGIEKYDYICLPLSYSNTRGRTRNEYALSVEFTKHLVLQSTTVFGKEYRKYLISFEEKNKTLVAQIEASPNSVFQFMSYYLPKLGELSKTAETTVGAMLMEKFLGIKVPQQYLPAIDEERWSASEIGEEIGRSAVMVGRAANALKLKVAPLGIARLSIAKFTNKEIAMWYYNREAKNKILEWLKFN